MWNVEFSLHGEGKATVTATVMMSRSAAEKTMPSMFFNRIMCTDV